MWSIRMLLNNLIFHTFFYLPLMILTNNTIIFIDKDTLLTSRHINFDKLIFIPYNYRHTSLNELFKIRLDLLNSIAQVNKWIKLKGSNGKYLIRD